MTIILAIFIRALIAGDTKGEANTGDFGSSTFNEGWRMEGDDPDGSITLPVDVAAPRNEMIVIRNILPDDISDGMTMLFRTSIEDMYVYINGALRENYYSEGFEHMSYYLPSAYLVVPLYSEDSGKEIEVRITVKDKGILNEVRIGYGNNVWFKIIKENITISIIAAIVIVVGIASVFLFFFISRMVRIGSSVFYLGLLLIDMGIWAVSESRLRQVLFARPSLSTYYSFFSIEIAGVLVCMFFNEAQLKRYNVKYLVLETIMSLQIVVNILLSATGLLELYRSVTFSHIWFVIGIVIIIYNIISDIRSGRTKEYVFVLAGMGIFVLFAILEILNFYINPFRSFGAYICIGLLFLFVSAIMQETDKIYRLRLEKSYADAANKAKSDFLARMSHEIRSPINAVLGMNELILRKSRDPDITGYATNIETAGRSLLGVINDVLDFSKIENRKMDIIPVDYDPAYLISDAVKLVNGAAEEKGLSLKVHADREIPSVLKGDRVRLLQIILNLLTNAVKYTNEGRVVLTVDVLFAESDKVRLRFSVKDTGIGIKPEDKDRLFESFSRGDEYRNRNIEGTGLGLPIVSRLLELMDSSLEMESVYGMGSDFYFDIDQGISDAEPIGDYEVHIAGRKSGPESRKYLYAPDTSLLVIDDRPVNLEVVKGFLKDSGIRIVTALSGDEGIELMKKEHFDIVFFDHMMPAPDGVDTYRRCIEEGILTKEDPAVMMTANAVDGARNEYLNEGFTDYISKPITVAELENIIAKYLPEEKVSYRDYDKENEKIADPAKSYEADAQPDADEIIDDRQPELVDINTALKSCMGNKEMYMTVLLEFLKEDNMVRADEAYEAGDWDKYRIDVHSLKSGARYAGAKVLYDMAYNCEAAVKKGDIDFVHRNHDRLKEIYAGTEARINEILDSMTF